MLYKMDNKQNNGLEESKQYSGFFKLLPKVIANKIFELLPKDDLKSVRSTNKYLCEISTGICKKKYGLFNGAFNSREVKKGDKYYVISNLSYKSNYNRWFRIIKDDNRREELIRKNRQNLREKQLQSVHKATKFYLFKTLTEASKFLLYVNDQTEFRMITTAVIKKDTKVLLSVLPMHIKIKNRFILIAQKEDLQLMFIHGLKDYHEKPQTNSTCNVF